MVFGKFVILVLLAVAGPVARAAAGLPHAKVVGGLCALAEEKTLCTKTLQPIKSDDPRELAVAVFLATEVPIKNIINFLGSLKSKYKNELAYIETCEGRLKDALEDVKTFKEQAGKDLSTFAKNYESLKQLTNSVFVYQAGCTADVTDKKLLKELNAGMAEGLKMASNAVDIFADLESTFKRLGISVPLI